MSPVEEFQLSLIIASSQFLELLFFLFEEQDEFCFFTTVDADNFVVYSI